MMKVERDFRILVCGGRDYTDTDRVFDELYKLDPTLVITGGATGADIRAENWCNENGVPCMVFRPAWDKFKLSAGPIRNEWMLKYGEPKLVVAFPGGKGTENMVELARRNGIPVIEIKEDKI